MLVDEPGEPAWNMAVDAALLIGAAQPTLRCYGWHPHAVSLGYFQRCADFADLPPGTPLVRRSTGGGAIHHGDELTFSLAVDAAALSGDIAASYRLLHDAVVRALAAVGVACRRSSGGHDQSARPRQRWCFAAPVRDDLVTDRGKLLGSAQRRVTTDRARVLHHGSLVLRRPALTPFVAAVEDQLEPTAHLRRQLRSHLASELAATLGLVARPGELTAAERALAADLQRQRYGNPEHLHRR